MNIDSDGFQKLAVNRRNTAVLTRILLLERLIAKMGEKSDIDTTGVMAAINRISTLYFDQDIEEAGKYLERSAKFDFSGWYEQINRATENLHREADLKGKQPE